MSADLWNIAQLNRLLDAARAVDGEIGDIPARLWWNAFLTVALDTALPFRELLDVSRFAYDQQSGHLSVGLIVYKLNPRAAAAVNAMLDALPRGSTSPSTRASTARLFACPWKRRTMTAHCQALVDAAQIPATNKPFERLRDSARRIPDLLDALVVPVSAPAISKPIAPRGPVGRQSTAPTVDGSVLQFVFDTYAPGQINLLPNSAQQLAVAVRRFNAFAGHQVLWSELNKDLFKRWLKSLSEAGQSSATINGKRTSILTLWRAAYRLRLVGRPPKRWEVPAKREPRRLPNSWTVEQMEKIIAHCRKVKGYFRVSGIPKAKFLTSLVLFEYETATRFSASLAVQTCDLDIKTGQVYLRVESAKTGLEQVHWLSPQCLEAIAEIWDPSREMVWPWGSNRHSLWDTLRSVLKAAGLPSDRRSLFQRFRRTTATILTRQAGLSVASAALGHTSEAMTRRAYVDPTNLGTPKPIDMLPRLRNLVPSLERATDAI